MNINNLEEVLNELTLLMNRFPKHIVPKNKWCTCDFYFINQRGKIKIDEFRISKIKRTPQERKG